MQDLHYGLRRIVRSPAFSAVVVLTLALGIGANTALFSVIDAVLLRPLPYSEPDRLVTIDHHYPSLGDLHASVSAPGFRDYSGRTQVFDSVAVERNWSANLVDAGDPQRLNGAQVTGRFFGALGVPAAAGRPLVPGDDVAGHEHVTVLAQRLAQRLFGGGEGAAAARRAVGARLRMNGETYQVVGVMPDGFRDVFSRQVELWVPMVIPPAAFADSNRTNESYSLVARLRRGVSPERAQKEMTAFAGQLKHDYPNSYPPDWGLLVTTLHEKASGNVRAMLLVLLGAVGFVLLIACTNVASLLLARASGRAREIAVRTAIGASRWQLVRQLLIESLLLALAGGALGLALAAWALRAAARLDIAGLALGELRLDGTVLLFTLGVALATGFLFGLAPALATARADTQSTLKEGGRGSSAGRSRQAMRRGLVAVEVALALALLVSAGLLLKSFLRLSDVQTGFAADHLLTLSLSLPTAQYKTPAEQSAFFDRALARLAAVPGVKAVGGTSNLPFGGSWSTGSFEVEGVVTPPDQPSPWGDLRVVSPGFFRALEVPVRAGRTFSEQDAASAVKVAVVDEEMVRRFFPHGDPIGKRLALAASPKDWITIIGVVGHTKHEGLDAQPRVQLYAPYQQRPMPFMDLVLRTATEPRSALPAARAALREIDPALPVYGVHTMAELVDASTGQRRFAALLLGLFSAMALLLAALGIYGVMAFSVAQRSHELGVRMALGAVKGSVLGLVLRQGMALAAIGLAAGLLAALACTRLLASQLFAVRATDPWTFALVTAILAAVAFVANLLPALRATRVDPVIALREE